MNSPRIATFLFLMTFHTIRAKIFAIPESCMFLPSWNCTIPLNCEKTMVAGIGKKETALFA